MMARTHTLEPETDPNGGGVASYLLTVPEGPNGEPGHVERFVAPADGALDAWVGWVRERAAATVKAVLAARGG